MQLQATVLKFDLLVVWKLAKNAQFQNNISKIMPAKKKAQGHGGVNITFIFARMIYFLRERSPPPEEYAQIVGHCSTD